MNRTAEWFLLGALLATVGCAGLQPRPIFTSKGTATTASRPETQPSPVSGENPAEKILEEERDRSSPDLWRENLMREIDNLLGTPYQFGGSSPSGMDCSGFVQYVFRKALGLSLPRSVAELVRTGRPVSLGELRFGDLLFFRNARTKKLDHVGIYLSNGQFAHASRSQGVTFSSLNSSYYRDRLVSARRVLRDSRKGQ